MKILSKLIIGLLLSISIISCGDKESSEANPGGTFTYNSENRIKYIHPSLVSDKSTANISNQVFEGLVKLNSENLEVEPCLAESFEFNPKTFSYTFTLKENIFFHDNKNAS